MTIHWEAVEQHFTVVLVVHQFCNILENTTVLDLALSGVKGIRRGKIAGFQEELVTVVVFYQIGP